MGQRTPTLDTNNLVADAKIESKAAADYQAPVINVATNDIVAGFITSLNNDDKDGVRETFPINGGAKEIMK